MADLVRIVVALVLLFGIGIPAARVIAGIRTLPGRRPRVMRTRSAHGGSC